MRVFSCPEKIKKSNRKAKTVEQSLNGKNLSIPSASKQLKAWIKVYNSGVTLKASTGCSCMKKVRSTTLDKRLKIITECLANDKNYGAMALKYQCSYQQALNWVKRYEETGSKGLEKCRSRRAESLPSRTPEENYMIKYLNLLEKS